MKHVIIIGAGVIGAAIAFRLTKAGARVTVVDQAGPAAGASGTSFGWLNASFYADVDHHSLRVAGLDAMRRLMTEMPDMAIKWQSAIWFEDQGADLQRMADRLNALGYACQHLSQSEVAARAPDIVAPAQALHFTTEGVAEGAQLTRQLLAVAAKQGARMIYGVRATALLRSDERVIGVQTDAGPLYADQVIVAAGVGAASLAGIPMLRRPGLLMKTEPLSPMLSNVLVTPIGEIRQDDQGRLVMPTAIGHQGDSTETLTQSADVTADAALARLQALFPDVPLTWSEVSMAMRPVPQDGLPVVGAIGPGLYVAVMHSGMTLAAITGEYAAQEVLSADFKNMLGSYRPQRFG